MAGLHDIYISHAPPDRETAEMLGFFLRGEGLCCATSACGAPAAAGSARLLVLVFSGHAGACVSVQEEVALAAAANIPVILFPTEDAAPGERLEGLLRGACRIHADQDHPVFSVSDVVRRAAEALGRDLPGAQERDWQGKDPGTYAHVRITTNPPGGHIRVIWPPPVVEGPSPFYLTVASFRVEVEATMEGYEPKKCGHDIDGDTSAMDWRIGLRTVEAAPAARGNEEAAKLNDSGDPDGGEPSGKGVKE